MSNQPLPLSSHLATPDTNVKGGLVNVSIHPRALPSQKGVF
ncbi:P8 protein [Rose spring dwarf-associated virus]|uniref:p8 protein n=1 Tax=Rose spring dwarf-associated virus TaxID=474454 RepID=B3FHC5_9TOMB|nr:P8 protein [Rose spring dwarf-associated virus]ABV89772.1 P8 protein [Rose spring dwarf-associated virus]